MSFLKINNLSVNYEMRRETVYAAKNINIEIKKGEILGLVGESGSGKSTVGNAIINLIDDKKYFKSLGKIFQYPLNINKFKLILILLLPNLILRYFRDYT